MRGLLGVEVVPAALAVRGLDGRVIDALAERERSPLLVGLGRSCVAVDRRQTVVQDQRRGVAVQGAGVRQRPQPNGVRRAEVRALGLLRSVGAHEELRATVSLGVLVGTGLIAGHTVKPGSPPSVLAVPRAVSICTICNLASPRASARFDSA